MSFKIPFCFSDCVLSVEQGLAPDKAGPADTVDGIKRRDKPARYSIRLEYSAPPKSSGMARSNSAVAGDEGGFDLKLPPNRFRTRSIAIVAGYSPERVYSNMPPGAFVVESGVYKVGADRDYVKSEPIYWKQVVYGGSGSRAGSDGSGTYPRNLPPPTAGSGGGGRVQVLHGPRLVSEPNLELVGGPSLRASSPLDQGAPLVNWLSPINNYSDISSVPHPSSADRSIPSTLLTNPLSSISSPFSPENSSRSRGGGRVSTLQSIPEDSRLSVTADIHQSSGGGYSQYSQYSNLAEYTSGDTPPSRSASSQLRPRRSTSSGGGSGSSTAAAADFAFSGLSTAAAAAGDWSLSRDISFPGHQIGLPYFPAPVHKRAISPSTQYPASHIQPPRIPDIRVGRVDPKEVDIYQRIAKLDPENSSGAAAAAAANIRPLATSSPPGKRKRDETDETGAGDGSKMKNKYKYSKYPNPAAGPAQPPPRHEVQPQTFANLGGGSGRRTAYSNLALESDEDVSIQQQHRLQQRPEPQQQQRRSSRSAGQRLRDRESRLQTLRELSENESSSTKGDEEGRRDYDLVSVVSEGLDAEVTAITSSSSPESSGTNTLQQQQQHSSSSTSGIASKNSSQNQTTSSHSTSGSTNPATSLLLNQSSSLLLPDTSPVKVGSSGGPVILDDKQLIADGYDSDLAAPFYENWPPRAYQFSPASVIRLKPPLYPTYLIEGVTPPPLDSGVPPFTPHGGGRYFAKAGRVIGSSPDTSTETPPSRAASRPNSSQSAPLDRSVDRHYEWDHVAADDSTTASLAKLPLEWTIRRASRSSPHYNPRRDRDIGTMVSNNRDRVFSDSEIYSNVFPRRGLQIDVEARVRAMKKEFNEYRKTMNKSPIEADRLESLI